ncbi:MAG TPA: hypothetical protein VFV31_10860 [Chitinophagaceae bacterium]|nr:hypothetical protein [Chitinophagaceae bacterium]
MKWSIFLAFILMIAAGCEKSNEINEDISQQADAPGKNQLVGKWRLFDYYQDRGDGTGGWFPAMLMEEITFTADGKFSASNTSHLYQFGYNRYKIIDNNHVELYSTANNNREVYYYNRESAEYLMFNPKCRENCARRYKLVE